MAAYVNALLPDERAGVVSLRKNYHKRMSQLIRRRDWEKYELLVDSMRSSRVTLDEVSFTLLFNGSLLSPDGGPDLAQSLIDEMKRSEFIHPSLLRLHEALLTSLKDLEKYDAYPNELNLAKSLKPLWEISVDFKRNRMRAFRAFVLSERPELPPVEAQPQVRAPRPGFWQKREQVRDKKKRDQGTLERLQKLEKQKGLGWLSQKRKYLGLDS